MKEGEFFLCALTGDFIRYDKSLMELLVKYEYLKFIKIDTLEVITSEKFEFRMFRCLKPFTINKKFYKKGTMIHELQLAVDTMNIMLTEHVNGQRSI